MKTSSLEVQLSKIERLADIKAEQIEESNYKKYHHLFELTIKFLKKQKVLLYGGYAINELMPEKDKIYSKNTLPDIDVFTVDSINLAKDMIKLFKQNNIEVASFSEALHPGTYKVFVQGIQIVDITGVSKQAFAKLAKNSMKGDTGIPVVDPQFLRLSLHMLLSQANNADRWPKVFSRLNNFYRNFPPQRCNASHSERPGDQIPDDMLKNIYKFLQNTPFVVFGSREIQEMMGDNTSHMHTSVPWIQVIADKDVIHVAEQIAASVPGFILKKSKLYEGDDFIPPHLFLIFKGVKVVAIYGIDTCITYNKFHGLNVATIHTMLRMYLSMMFSPYKHFEKMYDHLECMTNALSLLQQKTTSSKKKVLQQLVIDCFGTNQGLITLRRERLLRLLKK